MITRSTPADPWSRWRIVLTETAREPLCVALANTCLPRGGPRSGDGMTCVDDLVRFARAQGVFEEAAATRITRHAALHPRAAQDELAATLALRDAIARLLSGASRPPDALALVTRTFDLAQRAVKLELRDGALAARARRPEGGLVAVRLQAAISMLALLASPHASRVRRCADDRSCGRWFVDATRSGSRRYCLAGDCGNRARQAAFRARHRLAGHSS